MLNKILLFLIVVSSVSFYSCSTSDPNSPGFEFMPDMYRGPAYETYSESPNYKTGSAMKPVIGSIPKNPTGYGVEQVIFAPYPYPNTEEGYEAAAVLKNPLKLTEKNIEGGKYLFQQNCMPCHGEKGDGEGILVQNGKINGVPSYYSDNLKELPVGKMYHSITYGKNTMGSHASQVNPLDRWKIIEYVQKLRADGLNLKLDIETDSVSVKNALPKEINQEEAKTLEMSAKSILFDNGKSSVKSESLDDLDKLVQILIKHPKLSCTIEGHTDNEGNPEANLKLSQDRVNEVAKYLAAKSTVALNLKPVGLGDTKPVADNATAVGKAKNRRVELVLK